MCGLNIRPKVSVIMGVYNIVELGDIFSRAVDSVLSQTMRDFEFLICDDGSIDDTWNLLQQIAIKDERVRLLKNEKNSGLAATLNYCLSEARGTFVARQDSDDISASDRFARQICFLEEFSEISFVGTNVDLWDESGIWGERIFPEFPQPQDFLFTMPFVHGALMFRKSALDHVEGYRVAKETRRAEDYDMLMRMYAAGLRGANLQSKLYAFLENQAAQKRRKYCYRIDEAQVRWQGFQALGLLPRALPYVVKPLIVGLIPRELLFRLKCRKVYRVQK